MISERTKDAGTQLAEMAQHAGRTVGADDHGADSLRVYDAATGEEIPNVGWARLSGSLLGILDLDNWSTDDIPVNTVHRRFYLQHTETGERWESA